MLHPKLKLYNFFFTSLKDKKNNINSLDVKFYEKKIEIIARSMNGSSKLLD
jgi:hypothetical protein